jgi:hypothetical protein
VFGPGIIVLVVLPLIAIYLLYWVIRVAVRHGILDAESRRAELGAQRAESVRPSLRP